MAEARRTPAEAPEGAIHRSRLFFHPSRRVLAQTPQRIRIIRPSRQWRLIRSHAPQYTLTRLPESSAPAPANTASAVSASSNFTCNLIPRVSGHSILVTFASARKHAMPADSSTPAPSSPRTCFRTVESLPIHRALPSPAPVHPCSHHPPPLYNDLRDETCHRLPPPISNRPSPNRRPEKVRSRQAHA